MFNLSEDDLANLRSRCEVIEPGPAFGTPGTGQWTAPLSVYFLEHQGQKFWVYDSKGFLCSTAEWEVVELLLIAEAYQEPDPARTFYRPGARELLFPGSTAEAEAKMLRMQEAAKRLGNRARGQLEDRAINGPKETGRQKDGAILLKTLGLDGDN